LVTPSRTIIFLWGRLGDKKLYEDFNEEWLFKLQSIDEQEY